MRRRRVRLGAVLLVLVLAAGALGCRRAGERSLRSGLRELSRGRDVRALAAFERSLSRSPSGIQGAQAWNGIGIACVRLGDTERAIEAFEKSHRLFPDAGAPLYNLGILLAREGDATEAFALLHKAAVNRPGDPLPLEYLGHLYLAEGMDTAALERLRQALAYDPASARIHTAIGLAEWRLQGPGVALRSFQQAVELEARYAPALYNLFVLWDDTLRRPERAAEWGRRFVKAGESPARIAAVRVRLETLDRRETMPEIPDTVAAAVDRAPERPDPVEPEVDDAPEVDPGPGDMPEPEDVVSPRDHRRAEAETHFDAGVQAERRGEYDAALVHYRAALESDPEYADAQWGLAELFDHSLDFTREAIREYRLFRQRFPADTRSPRAQSRVRELAETLHAVSRPTPSPAPALEPSQPSGVEPPARPADVSLPTWVDGDRRDATAARDAFNRGVADQNRGAYDSALRHYRRSLDLDGRLTAAAYNQATVYQMRGAESDGEHARRVYYAVLEREPAHVAARYNLAMLYQARGDTERALAHVRYLLHSRPEQPSVRYLAGRLYSEQSGNEARAVHHFERFLKLAPDDPMAEPVRRWLERR